MTLDETLDTLDAFDDVLDENCGTFDEKLCLFDEKILYLLLMTLKIIQIIIHISDKTQTFSAHLNPENNHLSSSLKKFL